MPKKPRSIVQVRLMPEDRDRVKAAAKLERRPVSAWLRALVLDTLDTLEADRQRLTQEGRLRGVTSGTRVNRRRRG